MAHKGRIYKLWYRRDASWSVNDYDIAYPEAFFVRARDAMVTTRYDVSSMDFEVAVNINKGFTRTWTSPPRGTVFDNTYWSIEISGPPDSTELQGRFRLKHSALIDTPLFDATYNFSQVFTGFGSMFLDQWSTLHFLSPQISLPANMFRVFIDTALYARYNP